MAHPKINGLEVGKTGFGLMGFTWRDTPTPPEKAIPVMKAALDSGCNFWNAGEFYGTPEYNSLHLLRDYFKKYPEDANKVVINIKGGMVPGELAMDTKEPNIRRSVDECVRVLEGTKKIDTFECARQAPDTSIEETVEALGKLVKEGKISSIGLSEVRAETIRRAAKVHKIESVEQEFSLFATGMLENGVAKACAELDIPIIAYSPLGHGFLTGQFKTYEDIEKLDDLRKHTPRMARENFDNNMKLVKAVEDIAQKKGCTSGQIAIAWIKAHSGKDGMPVIIPIPGATRTERVLENGKDVTITNNEMKQLDDFLKNFTVAGERVPDMMKALSDGLD